MVYALGLDKTDVEDGINLFDPVPPKAPKDLLVYYLLELPDSEQYCEAAEDGSRVACA